MKSGSIFSAKTTTRRDFIFKLGLGSTLAITGYYLSGIKHDDSSPDNGHPPGLPLLRGEVSKARKEGGLYLEYGHSAYFVNATGEEVIGLMDGRRGVSDIAGKLSASYGLEHNEMLDASVAAFIGHLAEAGFLTQPFYASVYERYE